MATSKKAPKKAAKRSGKKSSSKSTSSGATRDLNDVLKYLEKLDAWLERFHKDYRKLRIAVCNVERKAWGETDIRAKRFCDGGTTDTPADPERPPVW